MIRTLKTLPTEVPTQYPWHALLHRDGGHGDNWIPALALCVTTATKSGVRAQASELLAEAWSSVAPAGVTLPRESLRRGTGPRAGAVAADAAAGLWWASSISHSAAGPVVAAAVAVKPIDRGGDGPGITVGVDIEPVHRFIHPGVARLIAARAVAEAPPVSSGAVPLLAVTCIKEAIYKADLLQGGRALADYAWIEARRTEDGGWCGIANAVGDCTQRFIVGVFVCRGNWVAVAIAKR